MLSRGIKSVASKHALCLRATSVATYHHSRALLDKKAVQFKEEEDFGPFNKLAQGFNAVKSTILNAPPLQKITRPAIESLPFTGQATSWDQAVKEAQSLVSSADQERMFDPVKIVGKDLWELKGNITKLLGSGHPFIHTIGKHYLQGDTNRIRPLLVLLMAKATCQAEKKTAHQLLSECSDEEDTIGMTSLENPILPTQRRLAEISEMIYTATLLHYDVIDTEQQQIVNPGFGNKMAVLAGDFLLARASLALAQLKNVECIELIATCIANLVEGEFLKIHTIHDEKSVFDSYLEKVYLKTGSLIAQSCKSSAVLGGCSNEVSNAAYEFGKHLGIASQLISDVRDFSTTAANIDRKLPSAWINAPVLLAWDELPEMGPLIKREFNEEGDVEKARLLVYKSSGLKKTLALANEHIDLSIKALEKLPDTEARSALTQLARNLPTRKD